MPQAVCSPYAVSVSVPKGGYCCCCCRERMLERLRGVYSSGAVVPLPFLSASMAAPAALLEDVREAYVPLRPDSLPLVSPMLTLSACAFDHEICSNWS